MASMKLNTDNVRIIMQNLLDDLELWEIEGKEAENSLPISPEFEQWRMRPLKQSKNLEENNGTV